MKKTREQLKRYFKKGAYPTEGQFADLIDSCLQADDELPISQITGLNEALNGKMEHAEGNALREDIATAEAHTLEETRQRKMECEAIRDDIDSITESVGKPDGIAPLDSGGKIAERFLPSYVDDVVEFDSYCGDTCDLSYYTIVDEPPAEDTAGYSFRGVNYMNGEFWFEYWIYYGHTAKQHLAKRWPGCEKLGTPTADGGVVPVGGKIYFCANSINNDQYRWADTRLVMLGHSPIVLGYGSDNAFRGSEGRQLQLKIAELTDPDNSVDRQMIYDVFTTVGLVNITALESFYDEWTPKTLAQVLDSCIDADEYYLTHNHQCYFTPGMSIKFIGLDGWETWELQLVDGSYNPRDVTYWKRVDNAASGGGSCDCADDIAALTNSVNSLSQTVTNLQQTVENLPSGGGSCDCADDIATLTTSVNNLTTEVNTAKSTANQAKTTANAAKTASDNLSTSVNSLSVSVQTLQQAVDNLPSSSVTDDSKRTFIDVATDSSVNHGAHSSGLTYSLPTTKFNLMSVPTSADSLIILPGDLSLAGTIIRILDPRTLNATAAATAKYVRIAPYNSAQKLLGAEAESTDWWMSLKGGYVELQAVRGYGANGETTGDSYIHWMIHWMLLKKVTF